MQIHIGSILTFVHDEIAFDHLLWQTFVYTTLQI